MANNAGFGLVAELSEDVLNAAIAAYWANLGTPLTFTLPSGVAIGGETVNFTATLQLFAPSIALAARPDHLIAATFGCGGFLQFSIGAAAPTTVILSLSTTLDLGISVVNQNNYLAPALDLSSLVLVSLTPAVVQGPALPATVVQALNAPAVLGAMQSALRAIPPNLLALGATTVPAQLSISGVSASFGNVTIMPLAGRLMVAADLLGYSSGNAAALTDLLNAPGYAPFVQFYNQDGSVTISDGYANNPGPGAGSNIAATVNGPALLAFLNGPVAAAIVALDLPDNASIDSANFAIGGYQLPLTPYGLTGMIVTVDVSDTFAFSGTITIDFGVHGEAPGSGTTEWLTQQNPGTWFFRADNVNISLGLGTELLAVALGAVISAIVPVLAPLMITALAVVLAGVVPGLISDFETQAQNAINNGLDSGGSFGGIIAAVKTGALPDAPNATLTVDTRGLVISEDGFDSYAAVGIGIPGPPTLSLTLNGSAQTYDYIYDASPQHWKFEVVIPSGALNLFPNFISLTDPTIHVAWSVTGTNIDGAAFDSDAEIGSSGALKKTIAFDPNSTEFIHNDGLTVTATIYRLLDGAKWPVWTATIDTAIPDPLDITHNYIQWDHTIWFSTQSNLGKPSFFWTRNRKSVIHKTDRLQRCKNVVTAVEATARRTKYTETTNYSDSLPFPAAQAAEPANRKLICDFCFFRGPRGTHFVA